MGSSELLRVSQPNDRIALVSMNVQEILLVKGETTSSVEGFVAQVQNTMAFLLSVSRAELETQETPMTGNGKHTNRTVKLEIRLSNYPRIYRSGRATHHDTTA